MTLRIDWSDGSTDSITYPPRPGLPPVGGTPPETWHHFYRDDDPTGTPEDLYPIRVTATDDDGGQGQDVALLTLQNEAPLMQVLANQTWYTEGDLAELQIVTGDNPADRLTLTVDWGDGTDLVIVEDVGQNDWDAPLVFAHYYMDDDPTDTASDVYHLRITLTDDDTGITVYTHATTVHNAPPRVELRHDRQARRNETVFFQFEEWDDPGILDTLEFAIDFNGDGDFDDEDEGFSTKPVRTHTFSEYGTYVLSYRVRDDDHGLGFGSSSIQISPIDLDGKDALENSNWVSENEEDEAGILVARGEDPYQAQLLIHALGDTGQRMVTWDANWFQITGHAVTTQGELILSEEDGDVILTVIATPDCPEEFESYVTLHVGTASDTLKLVQPKTTPFTKVVRANFDAWDQNGNGILGQSEVWDALKVSGAEEQKGEKGAALAVLYSYMRPGEGLDIAVNRTGAHLGIRKTDDLPYYERNYWTPKGNDSEKNKRIDAARNSDSVFVAALKKIEMVRAINTLVPGFPEGQTLVLPDLQRRIDPWQLRQGSVGDCSYMSALLALNSPTVQNGRQNVSTIRITPQAGGAGLDYRVSFPGAPNPVSVSVKAPTDGEIAAFASSGKNGLWLSILEKAYLYKRFGDPLSNGYPAYKYANILDPYASMELTGEVPGVSISHVTGHATSYIELGNPNVENQVKQLLKDHLLAKGAVIVAGTPPPKPGDPPYNPQTDLARGHAHAIVDYDETENQVTVWNPWNNPHKDFGGRFTMQLDVFCAKFHVMYYELVGVRV